MDPLALLNLVVNEVKRPLKDVNSLLTESVQKVKAIANIQDHFAMTNAAILNHSRVTQYCCTELKEEFKFPRRIAVVNVGCGLDNVNIKN
jgi:hypothetical protein